MIARAGAGARLAHCGTAAPTRAHAAMQPARGEDGGGGDRNTFYSRRRCLPERSNGQDSAGCWGSAPAMHQPVMSSARYEPRHPVTPTPVSWTTSALSLTVPATLHRKCHMWRDPYNAGVRLQPAMQDCRCRLHRRKIRLEGLERSRKATVSVDAIGKAKQEGLQARIERSALREMLKRLRANR